jgi:hypothetical protein
MKPLKTFILKMFNKLPTEIIALCFSFTDFFTCVINDVDDAIINEMFYKQKIYLNINSVIQMKNVKVFYWILKNKKQFLKKKHIGVLIILDYPFDIIKRVTDIFSIDPKDHFIVASSSKGDLKLVEFFFKKGNVSMVYEAFDEALLRKHYFVLKWFFRLMRNESYAIQDFIYSCIRRNVNLLFMEWLSKTFTNHFINDFINTTIIYNRFELMKWMFENTQLKENEKAMDLAAKNGHLRIVEWLHFHRREGCTYEALNDASNGNHLDVVKWLILNKPECCDILSAITSAIDNDAYDTLKFLIEVSSGVYNEDLVYHMIDTHNIELLRRFYNEKIINISRENIAYLYNIYELVYYGNETFQDYLERYYEMLGEEYFGFN